jgi:hypothetical protein
LTNVYETGLIGFIALLLVARELNARWRLMKRDSVMIIVAFVWLIGIVLTTSYAQLLPLWVLLGLLLAWPNVFLAPANNRDLVRQQLRALRTGRRTSARSAARRSHAWRESR